MKILPLNTLVSLLICTCPVAGQETISSSIRNSTATNVEIKIAVLLEKSKSEIDFCKNNMGHAFDEIDTSRMGSMEGYEMNVNVITDGLIASKLEWYGDLNKAADYYYRDYLVQVGKKPWKSKHNWGSPGDSTPFPVFMEILKQNQEYGRILKVYPEYFTYYFLGRCKKCSRGEEIKMLNNEVKHDAELQTSYNTFMREWNQAKQLAKTVKPKPLEPAVQIHEWFYSENQDEVLKALDYYNTNKVQFMLEKALNHKDPVIAAKAKEYLDKFEKTDK